MWEYIIIDNDNSLKEKLEGQQADSKDIIKFRYIYKLDDINIKEWDKLEFGGVTPLTIRVDSLSNFITFVPEGIKAISYKIKS